MLSTLKEQNRYRETLFMAMLSVLCFGLSIFRFVYTGSTLFLFLNWNLFLAFIPWLLSNIALLKPDRQRQRISIVLLFFAWILFFPNAPYILTDLFHLRIESTMPLWFDLILILSFAWTGLLFGFLSLWNIEKMLGKTMSQFSTTVISMALLFLGSFGVYLGRYLRWNSWDVLREPAGVFYDIGNRFVNPFDHPRTWGMTLFLGIFLNIVYWSFRIINLKNGTAVKHENG